MHRMLIERMENRILVGIISFVGIMVLVGWVANWRPIEIYLYDWWPIRRRAQLYRRIAAAPVIVKAI